MGTCLQLVPIILKLKSKIELKAKLLFRASNRILNKQYCEINDWAKIIYNKFI